MSNAQIAHLWGAVKWMLGVIAALGFYLASYTFSTFSNKLDKVYDFTNVGIYRMDRLEKDAELMKDQIQRMQIQRPQFNLQSNIR
jgi:hypothetical protein